MTESNPTMNLALRDLFEPHADAKNRHFSLLVWVEAPYHLYTLKRDPEYRHLLAEGAIELLDAGLGLPPCLLGGDPEAVKPKALSVPSVSAHNWIRGTVQS